MGHQRRWLPDLPFATPTGPRLFTNLAWTLPRRHEAVAEGITYNLTRPRGDFDGDGKPDILLANGFTARLQEHPPGAAEEQPPKFGDWYAIGMLAP